MMKTVYLFDPVTGVFCGTYDAQECPLEEGRYIEPEHSTPIAPPPVVEGQVAVFSKGEWSLKADHRGEIWYDAAGTPVVIQAIGELPDPSWTQVAPPPTTEQLAAAARIDRDARISSMSWRYERHARELRLGRPTSDDIAALDTYVQALADLTKQEGFPVDIIWPELAAVAKQ